MGVILKIENVSKQYRLGLVGTGTLSHDLNRMWAKLRGKEDPYLKIGSTNDRTKTAASPYVWALKDINFEVAQGEVLGIIGKNGAGKSTLLKLLSRVTGPTTGTIKSKGRIASLLEVGTGFHPELTGRENIYLNGAILGMRKAEITSKLDEIVSFSGCEKYIDTPVKRYSSGMRVRLAFAVAAHLEPDILVVDEVLAVGDAEFQKKAIGKMQEISQGQGRTVLFVSHNMGSILSLCTRCVLLENGKIINDGLPKNIIDEYLDRNNKLGNEYINSESAKDLFIKSLRITNEFDEKKAYFNLHEPILINLVIANNNWGDQFKLGIGINDKHEKRVLISSYFFDKVPDKTEYNINALINKEILTPGVYKVDVSLMDKRGKVEELFLNELSFEIESVNTQYAEINYDYGYIHEKVDWKISK